MVSLVLMGYKDHKGSKDLVSKDCLELPLIREHKAQLEHKATKDLVSKEHRGSVSKEHKGHKGHKG